MSWGKIYCDTNWGENKYRTAGSIINEATPDCFQFPEFVSFKDHVRSEGATYEKMQCGIDILLFLGRSISITPQSPDNPTFSGILDTYTGATAGYSTRRLTNTYTGGLIRVRRSSDDAEQDMGYDSNGEDLDTFGLLAFVNADVDTYTSDFSSGTDSFTEHSTTNAGNIDGVSDGTTSKDDVLRVTMTGGSTSHQIRKANIFDGANTYDISFEYYIPSANTKLDQIVFRTNVGGDGDTTFSNVGTWSTGSISDFTPSGTQVRFNATDGGAFIFDADGDVFYLKNIVVTQTTADGHITTWYDQTGNGNHATNSTASEQSKIVDGGSIIYEGATISRPAMEFDGVDDTLGLASNLNIGGSPSIIGVLNTAAGDIVWRAGGNDYWYFQLSQIFRYRNGDFDATWINSDGLPNMTGSQKLVATYKNSTSVQLAVDGTSIATKSSGTGTDGAFNHIGSDLLNIDGVWQELIIYTSDQSSNRTGIEGNIDNYFRIT